MYELDRQEEYYNKAMKSFIEAGNNFQKLIPQNKERFILQLAEIYGVSDMLNALRSNKW